MRWLLTIVICAAIMQMFFACPLFAQVKVTGHVFAEIVESLSVNMSSNPIAFVDPENNFERFEMGEWVLSGGAHAAYNLVLNSDGLNGDAGTHAPFLTVTDFGNTSNTLGYNGKQVVRLFGSFEEVIDASIEMRLDAAFKITFAYN